MRFTFALGVAPGIEADYAGYRRVTAEGRKRRVIFPTAQSACVLTHFAHDKRDGSVVLIPFDRPIEIQSGDTIGIRLPKGWT